MAIELYNQKGHVCLMFTHLSDEGGEAVQANQFLIVHEDHGCIIDPGGNMAYNELLLTIGRYFSPQKLDKILASHADPDDGDLGDLPVTLHTGGPQQGGGLLQQGAGPAIVIAIHREGEVGGAIPHGVLHYHVDIYVGVADRIQDLRGHRRPVRHTQNGQAGLVAVERNAGYQGCFHPLTSICD